MNIVRKDTWESRFRFNALSPLLESGNKAIALFACRGLNGRRIPIQSL